MAAEIFKIDQDSHKGATVSTPEHHEVTLLIAGFPPDIRLREVVSFDSHEHAADAFRKFNGFNFDDDTASGCQLRIELCNRDMLATLRSDMTENQRPSTLSTPPKIVSPTTVVGLLSHDVADQSAQLSVPMSVLTTATPTLSNVASSHESSTSTPRLDQPHSAVPSVVQYSDSPSAYGMSSGLLQGNSANGQQNNGDYLYASPPLFATAPVYTAPVYTPQLSYQQQQLYAAQQHQFNIQQGISLNPNNPIVAAVCTTLFAGNLGSTTTERELHKVFETAPGFRRVRFTRKGSSAPVAFIEFENEFYSINAMRCYQGQMLSSCERGGIRLEFARTKMGVPVLRAPPPLQMQMPFAMQTPQQTFGQYQQMAGSFNADIGVGGMSGLPRANSHNQLYASYNMAQQQPRFQQQSHGAFGSDRYPFTAQGQASYMQNSSALPLQLSDAALYQMAQQMSFAQHGGVGGTRAATSDPSYFLGDPAASFAQMSLGGGASGDFSGQPVPTQ